MEVTASDKVGGTNVNLRVPANVIPITRIIIAPDGGKAFDICSSMQITPTLILTEAHCLAKDTRETTWLCPRGAHPCVTDVAKRRPMAVGFIQRG